jgi:hypothetical protein
MADNIEYADFSDLQNQALPDSVPDEITEQGSTEQHQPIDYFDENLKEPKEETQEVKPPEVKDEKENPDSYKYWQSQADKRDRELREEREKREKLEKEFETIKSQINPPPKEEPLVPPIPPRSDDPIEEIRYAREYAEYMNKVNEQRFSKYDAYFQQQEAERQQRLQKEQSEQQRAWMIGQLVQAGASPEEAPQILSKYAQAQQDPLTYFKDLVEFDRYRNGKPNPKSSAIEQRGVRQNAMPPLGVMPSEAETQKTNADDEFFGDMRQFVKRYY